MRLVLSLSLSVLEISIGNAGTVFGFLLEAKQFNIVRYYKYVQYLIIRIDSKESQSDSSSELTDKAAYRAGTK